MSDALQTVIERLSQGADPSALLREMVGGDPRLQPLLEQLGRPPVRDVIDAEQVAPPEPDPERRARGRARLQALLRELDELSERNARLARALGACECFGSPDCDSCGGRGRPGFYPVDERLFDAWVRPALRRRPTPTGRPAPTEESR